MLPKGVLPPPFPSLRGPLLSDKNRPMRRPCTLLPAFFSIVFTIFDAKFIYLMHIYVSPPKKIIAPPGEDCLFCSQLYPVSRTVFGLW